MYKYSVKLILYTHQSKNGLFPIYLRIIVNGKPIYLATNHRSSLNDWDEKKEKVKLSHPTNNIVNPEITTLKNRALDLIVKLQVDKKIFTSQQIKKILLSGRNLNNIFDFADSLFEAIESKKSTGTMGVYRRHMIVLKKFNSDSRELFFEQIDDEFLTSFEEWLNNPVNIKHRKKDNTNYSVIIFRTLKRVFNAAKRKKIIDFYPFDEHENPTYRSPEKNVLSKEELTLWENHINDWKNETVKQAAIYFLLGCYSGLRVSDWYLFKVTKNVHKDYIRLRPKKTERHDQWVIMPLSKPLLRIIELIKKNPLTASERSINDYLKLIAKRLKINKSISSHTGRHTFAVTVCLENRVTSETAAELMGITLNTFITHYSQVTPEKIERETREAWANLS